MRNTPHLVLPAGLASGGVGWVVRPGVQSHQMGRGRHEICTRRMPRRYRRKPLYLREQVRAMQFHARFHADRVI